jgi:hypothetical protein
MSSLPPEVIRFDDRSSQLRGRRGPGVGGFWRSGSVLASPEVFPGGGTPKSFAFPLAL